MIFADKKDGRNLSILFKLSRDEKEFLTQEARRRGVSQVALIRGCLRTCLSEGSSPKPVTKVKRSKHVGNHT